MLNLRRECEAIKMKKSETEVFSDNRFKLNNYINLILR